MYALLFRLFALIESSIEAFEKNTGIRYPASEYRLEMSTISLAWCKALYANRHDFPFGKIGSKLDMFHEQLPLPVPCYDLVLVTEFAVVPAKAGPSGTPSSLDLTGGEYKTRERIHPGLADPGLLAIPAS